MKFDLLGLGMLSAIQYCFELITEHHGVTYELRRSRRRQPCVYDMLCAADSIGVFQVESRAQMATLPRLQAAMLLRPGHRGRADPSRPDPGRLGAPVHPAQERRGAGHLPAPAAEGAARAHARHPAVPGTADADRGRGRRLHARPRPTSCAARWARSARRTRSRRCASGSTTGMAGNGITGAGRRRDLREDQGVRRVRLRRVALDLLRAAGLRLVLAQAALPGGVLRGAAQRPADGLLLAAVAGARREAARRRGAQAVAGRVAGRRVARARRPARRSAPCLDAPQPAVRLGLASVRTIGDDARRARSSPRARRTGRSRRWPTSPAASG